MIFDIVVNIIMFVLIIVLVFAYCKSEYIHINKDIICYLIIFLAIVIYTMITDVKLNLSLIMLGMGFMLGIVNKD